MAVGLSTAATSSGPSGTLFVANKAVGSVSKIRLNDGREVQRDEACETPHELAASPDGAYLAVGCYSGHTIEILSTENLEGVATISLDAGARPHGVVWHRNGSIYATAEGLQRIYRIDHPLSDDPEISSFSTGQDGSHMIVVSDDASTAWTTNLGAGTTTRVALGERIAPKSVDTGEGTEGIALSPDGRSLWVSARGTDQLMELDPRSMETRRSIAVGAFPLRVAISPDGRWVVTSNLKDGSVSVVEAASGRVERTIPISGVKAAQQVTLAFSPDGKRLYVAETQLSKIAEVDLATGTVMGRLAGGVGGDGLAIVE